MLRRPAPHLPTKGESTAGPVLLREEQAIETRHLKIFVAVYKHRSFTKASELLHTSQPTISEHIRNLELRLDCQLFDRLGRSIMPTLEADILYPRALTILEDIKKLEEEVASAGKAISGELIIGASTIPGTYILPEIAAAFKTLHPGVSFEIRTNDSAQVVNSVLSHEILLGIVGAKMVSKKLNYHPFIEDELVLAASTKRKISPTITIRQLQELPFLMREEGSGTRKTIEGFLAQKDLDIEQLDTCAILGSSAAIQEAVKSDLGVSIISRYAIQDGLKFKQIKEIAIEGLTMRRNFYIITAKKRTLPNQYQVFLDSMLNR
jgi:DNA-binding transcriptional LysR family regulator